MRILQVTNRIPFPLNDGGNIATWNVTKNLHELGHEVTMAALNTVKHHYNPQLLPPFLKIFTVDVDTKLTVGGLVNGYFSSKPYNVARFDVAEMHLLLDRLCRENEFDVVQFEGIYLAWYIETVRRASKASIVLRSHNVEHQIWERLAKEEPNFLKRVYLRNLSGKIRKFEKENLHLFDGIAAITPQDADFYRDQKYTGKLKVIPAGVDLSKWGGSETFTPNRIAFLGSLEWLPNLQGLKWFLKDVWEPVISAHPEAELHVAGKNPTAEAENLTAKGMTFHGMVPDAPEFVRESGLFVVPLLSGGGMRLKIVEAMAAGRCVISTPIGAEGIDAEDGKEIILVADATEFREKLSYLLKHPEEAQKIGEAAAKKAAEKYSWKELVRGFEALYFALL